MDHLTLYKLSIYAGKTAVVLVFIVVLYRLIGKRDIAQMNVYDLVTIMAVANAVQNAMTGGRGELLIGIATSATLILAAYFVMRVIVRLPFGEKYLLGQPVLILNNGQIITERIRREHISHDELIAALRAHGLHSPAQAAMAVLEVDGSISVIPKDDATHINTDLL